MRLYGGSISLCIPSEFEDASRIRQIPDHQEVWISREDPECSLVVELLLSENFSIQYLFH